MINLIMNEKDFIETIINNKEKPSFISNRYLIKLLYRYYYDSNLKQKEMINKIFEKCKDIKIDGYIEYLFYNQIVSNVKEESKREVKVRLRELEYIPLYESELNIINSCKKDREKKFLFVCYILSRFYQNDWIGTKDDDLFKIANISMTEKNRQYFIYEMKEKGYITLPKNNTNMSIKLLRSETIENDKEVMQVFNFDNLGNQFLAKYKEGYLQCSNCGKLIKIKSKFDGSSKYCDKCAYELHKEQDRIYQMSKRSAK